MLSVCRENVEPATFILRAGSRSGKPGMNVSRAGLVFFFVDSIWSFRFWLEGAARNGAPRW